MARFACSIAASQVRQSNLWGAHTVLVVRAASQAEAEGIAVNVARDCWPTKDGWYNYSASVVVIDDSDEGRR